MNRVYDDGSVVAWYVSRSAPGMPKQPSLENRVRTVERKVTKLEQLPARIDAAFARLSKELDARLEKRFRAEGEMMDERFAEVYTRMDERFAEVYTRMDERFAEVYTRMDARFERVDERFDGVDRDLKVLREGMKLLLERSSRSGM